MSQEREFLLRTVLGEAARQDDDGMAAVAHVILNRKNAGNFGGGSIRDVVTAKHQFEPWGSAEGRARMYGYKPGSPAYDKASAIVDGVLSGRIADPTGGATHFLNEEIVRQRRGGSLPRWAEEMGGSAHRIGDHTFFGGERVADASGGFNEAQLAAIERAKAKLNSAPSFSPEQQAAIERAKARISGQSDAGSEPSGAGSAVPEDSGSNGSLGEFFSRPVGMMAEAATAMVNDLNSGFQGVNPVAVSKSPTLGVVERDRYGSVVSINIDGQRMDPSQFDATKFVTSIDPKTGMELLHQRTDEMEESGAASAGRVLGFSLPTSYGPKAALKPAPAAEAAAEALNVKPSLGMTGRPGAMLAAGLESNIVTAGPATRDAARAAGEISDAAEGIAKSAGQTSNRVDAGNALRQGAERFKDAFQVRADKLFDAVEAKIPPRAGVEVESTAALLREATEVFAETPNIAKAVGNAKFSGWLDDIAANDGVLTYAQLKSLRTAVGEAIGSLKGPLADTAGGKLKQLYASLTEDMSKAAQVHGAGREWRRANQFYAAGRKRIDDALGIVFKADAPEAAFEKVIALGAGKGQRANIGKLAAVKKAMSIEEWGAFTNAVITRMGQATPGAVDEGFSAASFLTNYRKLDPAARKVLFKGKGLPASLSKALDDLAEVAESARAAGIERNHSNSAAVAQQAGMTGALATSAVMDIGTGFTLALSAGLANLTARGLTQPGVIRALTAFGRTGATYPLRRLANGKGQAAVEAGNALRLIEQHHAAE